LCRKIIGKQELDAEIKNISGSSDSSGLDLHSDTYPSAKSMAPGNIPKKPRENFENIPPEIYFPDSESKAYDPDFTPYTDVSYLKNRKSRKDASKKYYDVVYRTESPSLVNLVNDPFVRGYLHQIPIPEEFYNDPQFMNYVRTYMPERFTEMQRTQNFDMNFAEVGLDSEQLLAQMQPYMPSWNSDHTYPFKV